VAVTLAQVRTQIADRPQIYPPPSALPEICGYGDGVATTFALGYENMIPGSLTVYTAPIPAAGQAPTFTAMPATAPVLLATTAAGIINTGVNTITPASMAGIAVGGFLLFDTVALGIPEVVQVASVTGTSFTAAFAYAHHPIRSGRPRPA
jgi:hypothetical protein